MALGIEDQVHSAWQKLVSKLFMPAKCSTECYEHVGTSSGGQNFQIKVSLGEGGGGKVS